MILYLTVNRSLVSHLRLLKITLNFRDAQRSKALLSCLLRLFPCGSPEHRFCRGIIKCTDKAELKSPSLRYRYIDIYIYVNMVL